MYKLGMNKQTLKELKSLAKEHGIKGYYLMNKAELIENLANEIHFLMKVEFYETLGITEQRDSETLLLYSWKAKIFL